MCHLYYRGLWLSEAFPLGPVNHRTIIFGMLLSTQKPTTASRVHYWAPLCVGADEVVACWFWVGKEEVTDYTMMGPSNSIRAYHTLDYRHGKSFPPLLPLPVLLPTEYSSSARHTLRYKTPHASSFATRFTVPAVRQEGAPSHKTA